MIYKTRKNRKYRNKKHNKSMKGGEYKTPEEIMREIKQEHSDPVGSLSETIQNALPELPKLPTLSSATDSIMDSQVVQSASTLAQGFATNTLEKAGDLLGVDVDNPQQVTEKLENINQALTNPENVEKVKDLASNLANVGLLGLQAAEPFIDPLINKVADTAQKGLEKTSKVALNTATNVAGLFLGPIIDIPRTVMSALETGESVINTGSEIITTTSDTINAMTQNFKQIARENQQVLDRTQQSIQDFVKPVMNNPTSSILKKTGPSYTYPSQLQNQYKTGGTNTSTHTRKRIFRKNKYKNKSKKVRFYFE